MNHFTNTFSVLYNILTAHHEKAYKSNRTSTVLIVVCGLKINCYVIQFIIHICNITQNLYQNMID